MYIFYIDYIIYRKTIYRKMHNAYYIYIKYTYTTHNNEKATLTVYYIPFTALFALAFPIIVL